MRVWRGCGASILEDTQSQTEKGPGQAVLVAPALSMEAKDLQRSVSKSTIQWYYEINTKIYHVYRLICLFTLTFLNLLFENNVFDLNVESKQMYRRDVVGWDWRLLNFNQISLMDSYNFYENPPE